MHDVFDIAVLVVFVTSAAAFTAWLWRATARHTAVLRDEGFVPRDTVPAEIADLCDRLLGAGPQRGACQGGANDRWDDSAWWVSVDTGGDDPLTDVLTWARQRRDGPDLAVVPTFGVRRTTGLVAVLGIRSHFSKAGLHPLPDELQPYLSRRHGLLLYANEAVDLRDLIPAAVLDTLNLPGVEVGLAMLGERLAVWTAAPRSRTRLFELGRQVRDQLDRARPRS